MCAWGIDFASIFIMFPLDFGIWTVCYFSFFIFLIFSFIVIIKLICSDNSKTVFSFLLLSCLSFNFSFWFPLLYLQTFLNSILSSRSLRLTYNFQLSLLHCINIIKSLHRDEQIPRSFSIFCSGLLVFLLQNTIQLFIFPMFRY